LVFKAILSDTKQEANGGRADCPLRRRFFRAEYASLQPSGNPAGRQSQIEHCFREKAWAEFKNSPINKKTILSVVIIFMVFSSLLRYN
jgi:hypothetical protein